LFLANLLLRSGQAAEAVDALRAAMQKFPADDRLWSGLIAALIQAGRPDEARESLTELAASTVVPVARRHLAAAQGYEALGDAAAAVRQYQLAVAQLPDDPLVRLRYARLLVQWSVRAARSEYETVLRLDPTNAEARRALATLLAATGEEADWARATELLNGLEGSAAGDAGDADRLRALLLSHKGRTRAERIANCEAARQILARQLGVDGADSADLSRLLLARILERQSALSGDLTLLAAARDEYRAVLDRGPPSVERLSQYVDFLLRHAPTPSASPSGDARPGAAPPTPEEQSFLADAEAGVDQLRRLHTTAADGVDALAAAYSARILVARGEPLQAQAQIAEYAAQQGAGPGGSPTPAQLVAIGRMYSLIGAHAEAEQWYRKLTESTPGAVLLVVQSLLDQDRRREAATLCLETSGDAPLTPQLATVLAAVMTDPEGPATEDFSDAEAALDAALQRHSRDVNLLQAVAVMRASRREYDAAIALFRRILAIEPDHELTLNNLATVLAERPNQRAEALELIERAVALAGRRASLLDTQGTIYLKLGDAQQAVACLEEATAGGEADARYYLHLAAAYRLAQRDEDARRMLQEARGFGLEKFVLTDDDRALLMQLEQELGAAAPGEQL
jgi:tetratricopeptide (TPR) repeat protein